MRWLSVTFWYSVTVNIKTNMQFSVVLLVVVGLAYSHAAPADPAQPAVDETQKQFVDEVQKAFKPVEAQVRSLLETGEKTIETVGNEAAKASERFMDSAKEMLNSVQHTDRANLQTDLAEKFTQMRDELKANVRSILETASKSAEPMKGNLRSIVMSARDAIDMLEGKYLTDDGKELVRSLARMATSQFKLPEAIEVPQQAPAKQ